MTTVPNASPSTAPRPSVADIQRRLAAELSTGQRLAHVVLLLADLMVGIAVLSLWLTEPALPLRTHVAFAAMVSVSAMWAGYFTWTLSRRRVLFARQRVVAGRLALGVTSLFLIGALILAAAVPAQRATGLAAAAMGAVLWAVALTLFLRARRRLAELVAAAN